MKAFDTDVLSDLFEDVPTVVARMATVPTEDQFVPVVVVEEILRGRLDAIRKSQSQRRWLTVDRAYSEFAKSLEDIRRFRLLPYTPAADSLFLAFKAAKIRIGSQDLRIAAIAQAHGATLITRNQKDYALVPGLDLEVWH